MNIENEIKQVIANQGGDALDARHYQDDPYLQQLALKLIVLEEDGLGTIIDDASKECLQLILTAMLSHNPAKKSDKLMSLVDANSATGALIQASMPHIFQALDRIASDITASELGEDPDVTSYDYAMVL